MSKSYGNTIMLTDPEPVVRQKLKTMVTDPARVRRTDPGESGCVSGGRSAQDFQQQRDDGQGELKAAVRRASAASSARAGRRTRWCTLLNPMQERRKKYEENPRLAWDILEAGREAGAATLRPRR